MKLIYCLKCGDIIRFFFEERSCKCGKSKGKYEADGLNATISGVAIPLGFDNQSFREALQTRPKFGPSGSIFTAFVIPKKCDTVEEK